MDSTTQSRLLLLTGHKKVIHRFLVTDFAEFFGEQQVKLTVLLQLVKHIIHLTWPTDRR